MSAHRELDKLRELAAVARTALDLPAPGLAMERHDQLLVERARAVRAALNGALEAFVDDHPTEPQLAGVTAYLRKAIDEMPINYPTREVVVVDGKASTDWVPLSLHPKVTEAVTAEALAAAVAEMHELSEADQ